MNSLKLTKCKALGCIYWGVHCTSKLHRYVEKSKNTFGQTVSSGLIRSQCIPQENWRGWIEFSFVQKARCGRRLQSRVLWVITQCRGWWGTDCIAQNISNWPFCTLTHKARLSPHNKSLHFLKRCLSSFQRYLKSKWKTFSWSFRNRKTEKNIQYFRNEMSWVQLCNTESCTTFPDKLSVCLTCTTTLPGFAL